LGLYVFLNRLKHRCAIDQFGIYEQVGYELISTVASHFNREVGSKEDSTVAIPNIGDRPDLVDVKKT